MLVLDLKGEDGDVIAITPTLKSLYGLNEEDIVLVDLEGNLLTKRQTFF